MTLALLDQVRANVDADETLPVEAGLYVIAALEGEAALEQALSGEGRDAETNLGVAAAGSGSTNAPGTGVFVNSIAVQGFRGIGGRCTLELAPGPGLTVVVGRNGSGKSSFAEALELLLTGENRRWADRSAVWKQGWRNLHWTASAEIEASFTIEGERQPLMVRRTWPEGETDLEGESTTVRGARRGDGRTSLGWDAALSTYRPFLPYNELGSIADVTPSALFDMMSAALGIEALVEARKRLGEERRPREKQCKAVEAACKGHRVALSGLEDERARECARALKVAKADGWDLEVVELVLEGAVDPGGEGDLSLLRTLATLQPPDPGTVETAAARLREAIAAAAAVAATDAGRAREIADLLEGALKLHAAHGDQPCPVCGDGALGEAWRTQATADVTRLREEAAAALEAQRSLQSARRDALGLLGQPAVDLQRAMTVGVDAGALQAAWNRWSDLPIDASNDALAVHLDDAYSDLAAAAEGLRAEAGAALEQREDAWRPMARALRNWLPGAREAAQARTNVPSLQKAEKWLDAETARIREERFQPIADQAARVWEQLRQNSAVTLERLTLAGASTQRRLALDVSVDGAGGQALGVMSQGEIHALALSLFLPRVLLPQSPFGFVVIDDPVQAMDPGKVDGLARVLEMAAGSRQVIVFTHDERLPESIRRLGIPVRLIEVTRRAQSVVECRPTGGPVAQYLADAKALLRTDELPAAAAARAVPLYCRLAIEAACTDVVRRRRIGRGESHVSVEATLTDAQTLLRKLALALFDDAGRAGDVMERINREWDRAAGDAVGMSNRGPHDAIPWPELDSLVAGTADVTRRLQPPGTAQ